MAIRQLDSIKPHARDAVSSACPVLRTEDLPSVDLLCANPASYVLTRVLAPGLQEKATIAWLTSHSTTRLMLGHGVHCETLPGRPKAAGKRCIILFHGNCANASATIEQFACLQDIGDLIAVNAPGYGATPAPKTHRQLEWQMAANVRAVASHVAKSYAPKDVLWLGFSLGSAQAAMGFQEMPGSHLLLEAPFTHVRALVEKHVGRAVATRAGGWMLPGSVAARLTGVLVGCGMAGLPTHWRVPGSAFATDGLDTESKLRRCGPKHRAAGSRLGIIFAEHDEIMSSDMPKKLWEAYHGAGTPPDDDVVHCLLGVGHNGSYSDNPEVRERAEQAHALATQWSVCKLFCLDATIAL